MARIRYEWLDISGWKAKRVVDAGLPLFSFGSNIHPGRLLRRAPDSVFIGKARIGFARLRFFGTSPTRGGVATLRPSLAHEAFTDGVLTTLSARDLEALDHVEGNGAAYKRYQVTVAGPNRKPTQAVTYLRMSDVEAGPSQAYVDVIAAGCRWHGIALDNLRAAVAHAPAYVEPPPAPVDDGAYVYDTANAPRRRMIANGTRPIGGRLGGSAMIPAVPSMTEPTAAQLALPAPDPAGEDAPYESKYRPPAGRPRSTPPGPAKAFKRDGSPMPMPEWWLTANDTNTR